MQEILKTVTFFVCVTGTLCALRTDQHDNCVLWASIGECEDNPGWMYPHCPEACGACTVCYSDPMDIAFVVDSSLSVTSDGFNNALHFVNSVLQFFEISENKTRVAMVTFADGVHPEDAIYLSNYTNKNQLRDAVNRVQYKDEDYTSTAMGINFAIDSLMSESRRDKKRLLVVLTDGDSQEPEWTLEAARRAANMGMKVYAVGVGYNIKEQELFNIASDPDHVARATSYRTLNQIMALIRQRLCDDKSEKKCFHQPTELMFVLDSSTSVGHQPFEEGKKFINTVLERFYINQNTIRVAAVMYGDRVFDEDALMLGQSGGLTETRQLISGLTYHQSPATETGMGIDFVVDHFLPSARPHAARLAIVITDGDSQDKEATQMAAERARQAGVHIVAVGVGRNKAPSFLEELITIGGSKANTFEVDDYASMYKALDPLVARSCEEITQSSEETIQASRRNTPRPPAARGVPSS